MKPIRLLSTLAVAVLILAGCGNEPPTAGTPTEFATVCDRANDGQRVSVEGYLIFPNSFSESTSVMMLMHETDAFDSTPIGVQTPFGTEANQLEEVSDNFSDDDMALHLGNGEVAGFGEKVRVSGKVYFPVVEQEFPCALENPLFELGS